MSLVKAAVVGWEPARVTADDALVALYREHATRLVGMLTAYVDGSSERRLVAASVPAWSPDGRTIAVVDGLTSEVYLVAADGSSARRLTTTRGGNFAPSWSPDGTQLILGGTRRG